MRNIWWFATGAAFSILPLFLRFSTITTSPGFPAYIAGVFTSATVSCYILAIWTQNPLIIIESGMFIAALIIWSIACIGGGRPGADNGEEV